MPEHTDTERFDWMEKLEVSMIAYHIEKSSGTIILDGRETMKFSDKSIRQAIDAAIDKEAGE